MLAGYPTEYLRCRTFGHSWEEFVPVGKRKQEHGFRFSMLCVSCGMERHDILDVNGRLNGRQYVQPDGYKLGFPLPRQEARVEFNKRTRKRARRGTLLKLVQ